MNNKYRKITREYEGVEQVEFQTAGKLISIGQWYEGNTNTNNKKFIINTLEMELPDGRTVNRTALCYEGNYNHADIIAGTVPAMEVGKSYLTTLRFDEEGDPQLQVSHLTNANRATKDDFASLLSAAGVKFDTIKVEDVETQQKAELEGAPTGG